MIQQKTQPAPLDAARCPNPACAQPLEGARCAHCGIAVKAGRWAVERVLAQSAHSRVYVARDGNGQFVALKELHFALVPGTTEIDAFEREAKTLESLQLPGTPRFIERFIERFTEGSGVGLRLYLATEFVRGESLAERVARGPAVRGAGDPSMGLGRH